jgi:hypothetical protein
MKSFLILITLLAPAIAQAEWVKLASVGEGEVTVYVDPATIKREGNVVGFSALFDYATIRTLSGAPFQSATMQEEIDCAGRQSRTLAVSSHSEPMAGGHIVSTATGGDVSWTPIAPQSIVSAIFKFVCKEKELLTDRRSGQQSVGSTADRVLSRRYVSRKDKGPSRS